MKKVVISTDSCADEFKSILKDQNIEYKAMVYILGEEHRDHFDKQEEYDNFYAGMRDGAMPTTSMLNAYEMTEYFEELIKQHDCDIVHLTLSSGLSGTYDNTMQAANEVNEKHPNNKVYVVDSLGASQGQNMLARLAAKERDKGLTAEGIYNRLQEVKHNVQHVFFINDLFHLRRGGRISSAKAVIGTVMQTKPLLAINNIGKLDIIGKALGNKKAVKMIAEKLEEYGLQNEKQEVLIASADSMDDALLLKKFILKRFNKVDVLIKNLGPLIGSHTGPGALGVIFMGKDRPQSKENS